LTRKVIGGLSLAFGGAAAYVSYAKLPTIGGQPHWTAIGLALFLAAMGLILLVTKPKER